jgi:UDP-N-acetylglucosamine acyltransferase
VSIHPSAVVDPGACIDPSAQVGPFCVIGADVVVGAGTQLVAHVVVEGKTTLGRDNVVHPFARIGGVPQDKKYRGEATALTLGDHNVVRENVTINVGTAAGGGFTKIGSHCLLMANSHIAHDCRLGDDVILVNGVGLAGHVDIDDQAVIGGLAGIHQHCRVGRLAFVGGGSMVTHDVLPFCLVQGDRAVHAGPNVVGLTRHGWPRRRILALRQALRLLFKSGHTRQANLAMLEAGLAREEDDAMELCAFARRAERGICALREGPQEAAPPLPAALGCERSRDVAHA